MHSGGAKKTMSMDTLLRGLTRLHILSPPRRTRQCPLTLLTLLIVGSGCSPNASSPAKTGGGSNIGTVTVVIELNDETIQQDVEGVAAGTTVADVMLRLRTPAVRIRGSGAMMFVESIGGQMTTGGEGWVYRVNDEFADRGIGNYVIEPPATIHWRHSSFSGTD